MKESRAVEVLERMLDRIDEATKNNRVDEAADWSIAMKHLAEACGIIAALATMNPGDSNEPNKD